MSRFTLVSCLLLTAALHGQGTPVSNFLGIRNAGLGAFEQDLTIGSATSINLQLQLQEEGDWGTIIPQVNIDENPVHHLPHQIRHIRALQQRHPSLKFTETTWDNVVSPANQPGVLSHQMDGTSLSAIEFRSDKCDVDPVFLKDSILEMVSLGQWSIYSPNEDMVRGYCQHAPLGSGGYTNWQGTMGHWGSSLQRNGESSNAFWGLTLEDPSVTGDLSPILLAMECIDRQVVATGATTSQTWKSDMRSIFEELGYTIRMRGLELASNDLTVGAPTSSGATNPGLKGIETAPPNTTKPRVRVSDGAKINKNPGPDPGTDSMFRIPVPAPYRHIWGAYRGLVARFPIIFADNPQLVPTTIWVLNSSNVWIQGNVIEYLPQRTTVVFPENAALGSNLGYFTTAEGVLMPVQAAQSINGACPLWVSNIAQ